LSFCEIKPAVLQVEIHPYYQQPMLLEFCNKMGIIVTGYASLIKGTDYEYYSGPEVSIL